MELLVEWDGSSLFCEVSSARGTFEALEVIFPVWRSIDAIKSPDVYASPAPLVFKHEPLGSDVAGMFAEQFAQEAGLQKKLEITLSENARCKIKQEMNLLTMQVIFGIGLHCCTPRSFHCSLESQRRPQRHIGEKVQRP